MLYERVDKIVLMLSLGLVCLVSFITGGFWGKQLAQSGINSDNALNKYQKQAVGLVIAIALLLIILILVDKFNFSALLPQIIPSIILLYWGAYYLKIIFVAGFLFLGLLVALELRAKLSRKNLIKLIIGLGTISLALSFLFYFIQPVTYLLGQPVIKNGVVIQTTLYTCAPSAIATLGRYTQTHPNLTEKAVTKLTKTNRLGTTALVEIKVMQQLGLNPQYEHNLTLDDLIQKNKPALLHVKEKNKNNGVRFSHAVALLAFDAASQQFLIGNPYYGLQIKTVKDMENYWFGEAITVNI